MKLLTGKFLATCLSLAFVISLAGGCAKETTTETAPSTPQAETGESSDAPAESAGSSTGEGVAVPEDGDGAES